jgi:ankyrin repeat protein
VCVAGAGQGQLVSQAQPRIDFARDVQPILREKCVACHGPARQEGGFRLDRRSDALRGAVRPVLIPGSSQSSRFYHRLIGNQFGRQMPLTGALPAEQIETLRRWIDEGLDWPNALANETPAVPPDPTAVRLGDAIRLQDAQTIDRLLREHPGALKAHGRGGTTPLMYAALYGDAALLDRMLAAGADPNIRNDAGATALMWALDDIHKVRTLLDRGAEVNVRSTLGRTPLLLASAQIESTAVVRLLLERGSRPSEGAACALPGAAARGDLEVVRLLLGAGACDTAEAAIAALRANCLDCVDAIASVAPLPPLQGALLQLFPPGNGHPDAIRAAIDRGADVNARDAQSRPVLTKAVLADHLPADVSRLLIARGADVNARTPDGLLPLDFARRVGNPSVIDALERAGARATVLSESKLLTVRNNTPSAAVRRSLPLLQRSSVEFYRKSGCVSCHHNMLTAVAVAAARKKKIPVDESLARQETETVVNDARDARDSLLQGLVRFGGGPATIGYVLMGLAAGGHPSDEATDAMARLLRLSQLPDGHWQGAYRPPLESSEFTYTAVNLLGITHYGRSCNGCDEAVGRGVDWLSKTRPENNEDRTFRLLGLVWGHAAAPVVRAAIDDLRATQRSDGGWAQLPTLPTDAYATGEALFALREAGVSVTSSAYTRGVQFLLSTQLHDGSWFVRKRAHPTQPYFESGFPHGADQYISAAATNWATLALIAVSTR